MKEHFSSDAFSKRVFSFIDDDRLSLKEIKVGSEVSIRVRDAEEKVTTISFRVTRDAHLGQKTRWIYGKVTNAPDGEYHQVELKVHKGEPKKDTIEMFLQAPPITINKPR